MADCDLCGVAIPTVVPVRIFKPKYAHSYPHGMWQGLCEGCLDAGKKSFDKQSESPSCGSAGKCEFCGAIAQLHDVTISRPSFSKGAEEDTVQLCKKCLGSIDQAHDAWETEKAEEEHEHH
ncbi:F420H2 dehydrogenase subunit FpoO [Methanolobus sp. ZRKC5]|uniref:F420H2 dehydrogenase subunit FpoO n=1 Tax=Methanolobus sp. ZRKC5 TaxID=3136295 RepID=UPI00313E4A3A